MNVLGFGESGIEEGTESRRTRQEDAERARNRAWRLEHEHCLNAYRIRTVIKKRSRTVC